MSCVHVGEGVLRQRGSTRPSPIGMVVVGTNLLLNLILIWTPLKKPLGLTTSVGSAIQCVVVPPAGSLAGVVGIVASTAIMLPCIVGVSWVLRDSLPWVRALGIVMAGAIVFSTAARYLASEVWSAWTKGS